MRHRDQLVAIRMLEGVVIAVHALEHPPILLRLFLSI
jgi:hypothetical protein